MLLHSTGIKFFCQTKFFPFFKWQYRAGVGAGAEIREKSRVGAESEIK